MEKVHALICKSLYSLTLYAEEHPEHAEAVREISGRMAQRFEIEDIYAAIATGEQTATELERTDAACAGLFAYRTRLLLNESEHPDMELCESLENTISGTEGWQTRYPVMHYFEREQSQPSGPQPSM